MDKKLRSLSVHMVISRDHDRLKMAERLQAKHDQMYESIDRRMKANARSIQRSDLQTIHYEARQQNRSTTTLDEFMQREKSKQDQMIKAKHSANQQIRRASNISTIYPFKEK